MNAPASVTGVHSFDGKLMKLMSLRRPSAVVAICLALVACSDSVTATPEGGDAGTTAGSEAPSSCLPLLQPRAGVYPVTGPAIDPAARGASSASHQRNSLSLAQARVAADGAIDFDTGVVQPAKSISECYDRTKQDTDRRIQVSYGADDNDLVINLYLSAAGVVEGIQQRHRTNNVNVRVLVGPPAAK